MASMKAPASIAATCGGAPSARKAAAFFKVERTGICHSTTASGGCRAAKADKKSSLNSTSAISKPKSRCGSTDCRIRVLDSSPQTTRHSDELIAFVYSPNVRGQAGRDERVRLSTETESRPCLEHTCSAMISSFGLCLNLRGAPGRAKLRTNCGCGHVHRPQSELALQKPSWHWSKTPQAWHRSWPMPAWSWSLKLRPAHCWRDWTRRSIQTGIRDSCLNPSDTRKRIRRRPQPPLRGWGWASSCGQDCRTQSTATPGQWCHECGETNYRRWLTRRVSFLINEPASVKTHKQTDQPAQLMRGSQQLSWKLPKLAMCPKWSL